MLCLLARQFPAPPPLVSPLFQDWLDILQDLRPDAPEWEEADALIKWMEDIWRAKERELLGLCRERSRTSAARFESRGPPALIDAALPLVIFLEVSFEAYAPIRRQAASRAEEIERSP